MTTYKQLLHIKRQLETRLELLESQAIETKRAVGLLQGTIDAISPTVAPKTVESAEQLVEPIRQILSARGKLTRRQLRFDLRANHGLRAPAFSFDKAIEMLTKAGTIVFSPSPEGDQAWVMA